MDDDFEPEEEISVIDSDGENIGASFSIRPFVQ